MPAENDDWYRSGNAAAECGGEVTPSARWVICSSLARSWDISAGCCCSAAGRRVRLAFRDFGEGGRWKVGELGRGGENVRSGMLDLRISGEGGGSIPSLLFKFVEKNALGELGSAGVSGVMISAIDLGKSPTSGMVRDVLTDIPDVSEASEVFEFAGFSVTGLGRLLAAEQG